jgi:hypothetical protein
MIEPTDDDRKAAEASIRRGVPIGHVVPCSCFDESRKSRGCVGLCGDTVDTVSAAIADARAAGAEEMKERCAKAAFASANTTRAAAAIRALK